MKYFRVTITKTAKPLFSQDSYEMYDDTVKKFATIKEAREYIEHEYFYPCKKVKMYRDGKNGEAEQIGWIYCYKLDKCTYDDVVSTANDWVSIERVIEHSKPIL